jgi:hypothetical protein
MCWKWHTDAMNSGLDLIRQARQTDLAQWLRMKNAPLKKVGQWWYLENHDSLRIQGNKWYHNSRGMGGNSIDFLVYYYQMPAKQAINELVQLASGSELEDEKSGVKKKNKKDSAFGPDSIEADEDYRRLLAYLIKTRGITGSIVMNEIKNKRLYQEKGTANAVFVAFNEDGKAVGAETNGTLSFEGVRYKGIKAGSLHGYGYNTGQRSNPKFIMFFESAVDLLSFMSLSEKLDRLVNECLLVSMTGLRVSVVDTVMQAFGCPATTPVLCVDNDAAADDFVHSCINYPNALVKKPALGFKDWNEQLCFRKG